MDKFDPDMLWFDVEIGYYTTNQIYRTTCNRLWFDVEIGYYTTRWVKYREDFALWFDVEIGYYTTERIERVLAEGCDLM